jgi:hypothetical protein
MLIFIVLEMPIDLLMNLMALALINLTTFGALGWFLLQRQAAPAPSNPRQDSGRHL